jgi:hypothetical protein
MGFRMWVPRADWQRVLELLPEKSHAAFLDLPPVNCDDTTLKTVEQIRVIWLKGKSMARAFEVHHGHLFWSATDGEIRTHDLCPRRAALEAAGRNKTA